MGALQSKKTYQVEKMEKGLSSEIRKKSSVTRKEDRNTAQLMEEARKSILQAQTPKEMQNRDPTAEKQQSKQDDLDLCKATTDLVQGAEEMISGEETTSKDVQRKSVTYAVPIVASNVCEVKPKVVENKASEQEKPTEDQSADEPQVQEVKVDEAVNQNLLPEAEPPLPTQQEIEQELHDKVAFIKREDKLEKLKSSVELDQDDLRHVEQLHPKDAAEDSAAISKSEQKVTIPDKSPVVGPEISSEKQQEVLANKIDHETKTEPIDVKTEETPIKEANKIEPEIQKSEDVLPLKEIKSEKDRTEEKSTEIKEDIPTPKTVETPMKVSIEVDIRTDTNKLDQKSEDVKPNNESQPKILTYSVAASKEKHSPKNEDLDKIDEVINEIHTASKKNQDQIHTITVEEENKNKEKETVANSLGKPETIPEVAVQEIKSEKATLELIKQDETTSKIQKTNLEEITVDLQNVEKQNQFVPLHQINNLNPDTNFTNQEEQKAQDQQSQQLKVLEQEIVVHESDQEKSIKLDQNSETAEETTKDVDESKEEDNIDDKRKISGRNPQAVVVKPELPKNHLENKQEKKNSTQEIDPAMQKIQDIEEEVKRLREQILHFTGTSKDNEYLTLKEMLIRNMIKLDDLSTESTEEIRNERKKVIKFVQECLDTLERNVDKTKTNDSDSE